MRPTLISLIAALALLAAPALAAATGPATPDEHRLQVPKATPWPAGSVQVALPGADPDANDDDLAVTPAGVWVAGGGYSIDPASNAATGPLVTPESGQNLAVGAGSVWIPDYDASVVRRYDETTRQLVATIALPAATSPEGIVVYAGAVWVATHHGGTLVRIDPATNAIAATIRLAPAGDSGPQGVAAGLGSIWVGIPSNSYVDRIDARTNHVTKISFPVELSPCGGLAVGHTAVWVTSCADGDDVARIDPATNRIRSIMNVGGSAFAPAADGNSVWFVEGGDLTQPGAGPAYLLHLSATDRVLRRVALPSGSGPGGMALGLGSLWLSIAERTYVLRIPAA